jgi:hypothetical protein
VLERPNSITLQVEQTKLIKTGDARGADLQASYPGARGVFGSSRAGLNAARPGFSAFSYRKTGPPGVYRDELVIHSAYLMFGKRIGWAACTDRFSID